jgi:uncharacterized membrane protein YgcG
MGSVNETGGPARVRRTWFLAIVLLFGALWWAYRSPEAGWGVMAVVLVTAALANAYLDLRDWRIGVAAGAILGMLMAATCLGSGEYHPAALYVLVAAGVGFLFGWAPVSVAESEADDTDAKPKFKSGRGGDFGGGGASGRY